MIAAVLYARVSSREQEQEGYSIPAQLKILKEYALKNGYKIEREFVDVETAKTPGRKSFGQMVNFLKTSEKCRVILVEKTDRLYRNMRDYLTVHDLDVETHFVKENDIQSEDSKSHAKFVHGLRLLMVKNYSDNLREEVKKGMAEKAEQGIYPGHAPFGFINDRTERNIKIHPLESHIVKRMFELYATGNISVSGLRKTLQDDYGKRFAKSYIHRMLQNPFYIGYFEWGGKTYRGTHETFLSRHLIQQVRQALRRPNQGKYRKHEIAFRGLLTCARDTCTMTTEKKKGNYVYYRCSGYRGKCDTPRFTEPEISEKLGEILKVIYIPDEVMARIQQSLTLHQERSRSALEAERHRLEQRLVNVRGKMDSAYDDKLSGAITKEFWQRKMDDWHEEEQRVQMVMNGLREANSGDRLLSAKRILELANKAYYLYVTQSPSEQAKLLKLVLLNCAIDRVSIYPTYRKPLDMIFQRAKNQEWSASDRVTLFFAREISSSL